MEAVLSEQKEMILVDCYGCGNEAYATMSVPDDKYDEEALIISVYHCQPTTPSGYVEDDRSENAEWRAILICSDCIERGWDQDMFDMWTCPGEWDSFLPKVEFKDLPILVDIHDETTYPRIKEIRSA